MRKVLLDTHIFVWMITEKKKLSKEAQSIIMEAIPLRHILISAISLWEIAMLVQKQRLKFSIPLRKWIEQSLTTPGVVLNTLTPDILIESCDLPEITHNDPVDRMIIATARIENALLITRDQAILKYAQLGHITILKG